MMRILAIAKIALALTGLLCFPGHATAQQCDFSVDGVEFGNLTVDTVQNATALTTLIANCSGRTGQTIRVCARFAAASGGNGYLTSSSGDRIAFSVMSRSNGSSVSGRGDDVLSLDVPVDFSGRGFGRLVFGLRLGAGTATASAGRYVSLVAGEDSRVTYGDSTIGSCALQTLQHSAFPTWVVGLAITPTCSLEPGRLEFGTVTLLEKPVDSQAAVNLRCTRGTSYSIALEGANGSSDPQRRRLVSGPNSMTYALYLDAARTKPWGSSMGQDTLVGIGSGLNEQVRIFGRIHAQNAPFPGNYSDSIVMSVRY